MFKGTQLSRAKDGKGGGREAAERTCRAKHKMSTQGGYLEGAIKAWRKDCCTRRDKGGSVREGRGRNIEETEVLEFITKGKYRITNGSNDGKRTGQGARMDVLRSCAMWLTPEGEHGLLPPKNVRDAVRATIQNMQVRRREIGEAGGLGRIVVWWASRGEEGWRGIIEGWIGR